MGKFYRVFKIDYLNEFLIVIEKIVFNARHMIPQRFDIILIAKILRKRFLSFFSNEIVKKDYILLLIYNKGKIMIFICS